MFRAVGRLQELKRKAAFWNHIIEVSVVINRKLQGKIMPRLHLHHDTLAPAVLPGSPHTRYLIVQQEDVWFIKFDGEEYGPYKTEREAMLFAIDAAHKLGEQGEETQVLQMDENAEARPVWTSGHDPYPPRQ